MRRGEETAAGWLTAAATISTVLTASFEPAGKSVLLLRQNLNWNPLHWRESSGDKGFRGQVVLFSLKFSAVLSPKVAKWPLCNCPFLR